MRHPAYKDRLDSNDRKNQTHLLSDGRTLHVLGRDRDCRGCSPIGLYDVA
jgi:hypothetical protein